MIHNACADQESFVTEVTPQKVFFWLMRGRRIQIPLKAGHHRPVRETPFKWPNFECWLGSFLIFQGICTVKEPYVFVAVGEGPDPPFPSLDPRMIRSHIFA